MHPLSILRLASAEPRNDPPLDKALDIHTHRGRPTQIASLLKVAEELEGPEPSREDCDSEQSSKKAWIRRGSLNNPFRGGLLFSPMSPEVKMHCIPRIDADAQVHSLSRYAPVDVDSAEIPWRGCSTRSGW